MVKRMRVEGSGTSLYDRVCRDRVFAWILVILFVLGAVGGHISLFKTILGW